MKFICMKTDDGRLTGKIAFYCRTLKVSRQGFYKYILNRDKAWKYEDIAEEIRVILREDAYNDTYGRIRIYQALKLKYPDNEHIPSKSTIYRIMQYMGLCHKHKRKPKGITKADKIAKKSDDLLKRNFKADVPLTKCVTDITEIKTKEGKLYVSAIFDCYDLCVLGIAMSDNMRTDLCTDTLKNTMLAYPDLSGAIIHSDRGSQYTSEMYKNAINRYHLIQSMNSDGGRCHDNARCESMWARMKEELIYGRYNTLKMTREEVKTLIWRYYMSYWNNRRICSSNGGLPPMLKRAKYYESNNCLA